MKRSQGGRSGVCIFNVVSGGDGEKESESVGEKD